MLEPILMSRTLEIVGLHWFAVVYVTMTCFNVAFSFWYYFSTKQEDYCRKEGDSCHIFVQTRIYKSTN